MLLELAIIWLQPVSESPPQHEQSQASGEQHAEDAAQQDATAEAQSS